MDHPVRTLLFEVFVAPWLQLLLRPFGQKATFHPSSTPLLGTTKAGTILVHEGTPLPKGLRFESGPCAARWRFLQNMDAHALTRRIHEAGWSFFYLAGEIRAIVFGHEGQKTVRKAVERILAKLKSEKFNSLEITEVVSKRFLGVPYAGVTAHSRHIQQGALLSRPRNLPEWN